MAEYRAVLRDEIIVSRYPELTEEKVEVALRRFRYLGEYLRTVKVVFQYPRDPLDQKVIELAIAGRATDIVSADNDLLSLPSGYTEPARRLRQRLPGIRILSPGGFIELNGRVIGVE